MECSPFVMRFSDPTIHWGSQLNLYSSIIVYFSSDGNGDFDLFPIPDLSDFEHKKSTFAISATKYPLPLVKGSQIRTVTPQ